MTQKKNRVHFINQPSPYRNSQLTRLSFLKPMCWAFSLVETIPMSQATNFLLSHSISFNKCTLTDEGLQVRALQKTIFRLPLDASFRIPLWNFEIFTCSPVSKIDIPLWILFSEKYPFYWPFGRILRNASFPAPLHPITGSSETPKIRQLQNQNSTLNRLICVNLHLDF